MFMDLTILANFVQSEICLMELMILTFQSNMSKQNQLGGIDDFKEFKSDLSKQNQLGGSDALGKSFPISYCMHFWTQGST